MTFNTTGASLIKHNIARKVDKKEGLDLLQQAYDHNLVQFGENVRENVNFICNCCGCCCEAMIAAREQVLLVGWDFDLEIENALLLEIKLASEREQEQLKLGQQIQASLLPQHAPRREGLDVLRREEVLPHVGMGGEEERARARDEGHLLEVLALGLDLPGE